MQVRINRNSGMEFSFRLTDQNFGMEFSFRITDWNSGMEFSFPLIRILDMYPQGNQTGCTFCGLKTQFYNDGILQHISQFNIELCIQVSLTSRNNII